MLHASELRFMHPYTQQPLVIRAGLDEVWQGLLSEFGWQESLLSSAD